MNIDFQNRTNDYFNGVDYYLVETNLNKLLITRMIWHAGNWYTEEGMQYKATSVPTILASEGIKRVSGMDDSGKTGTGRSSKFLGPDQVGVIWDQGSKINPQFWCNYRDLTCME